MTDTAANDRAAIEQATAGPGPAGSRPPARPASSPLGRVAFLGLSIACFAYLYVRLNGAAAREGLSLVDYMAGVFANVEWVSWVGLMIAYSGFYFLIDTLVVTRALNWFVAPIRYRDLLPVRASAYIISIFNEQIGKGAMAWYLPPAPSGAGLGSGLGDAVRDVLRGVLPAVLGDGGVRRQRRRAARGVRPAAVGCRRRRAGLRGVAALLPRRAPAGPRAAEQTDPPCVPLRDAAALRAVSRVAVAGAAGCGDRLHDGAPSVRSRRVLPVAARLPAGHLLRGRGADADAGGRDHLLGHPVPRETRARWPPSVSCSTTSSSSSTPSSALPSGPGPGGNCSDR